MNEAAQIQTEHRVLGEMISVGITSLLKTRVVCSMLHLA